MENYQLLVNKLDQFIRKYYVNKLIRGLLYFTGLVLALFLLMSILEYYFYFGKTTRKVLFYSFVGISGWSLYAWILKPIFQYFRLGKTISHEQAAQIIGNHFGNVQDKLLNVLQLKQLLGEQQKELVMASIDQKSESIKLVPFRSAINLALNRKYLKYALPPLLLLLVLLFAAPSLITDSAFRLIRNNVDYEKPAPYAFNVQNEDLKVIQYETFPLTVQVEGEVMPNEVFIEVEDYEYRMVKRNKDVFVYEFNNVQEDTEFRIYAGEVVSKAYTLDVLEKPNLLNIDVDLDFPAYISRRDERLNNIGDLVIPTGTKVNWNFQTSKTDGIDMAFVGQEIDPTKIAVDQTGEDQFSYSKKVLKSQQYKLFISNNLLPNADSVSYTITVQPDLFPTISSEQFRDSLNDQVVYFAGEASDDYGLLSLSFNYTISKDGNQGEVVSFKLDKPSGNNIQFNHVFDLKTLNLEPGDQVSYFFEVYDNDQVNGSKSARTNTMLFSVPSKEELKAQANKNEEQIKEDLQSAIEESKKIQEELKKLREKLLQEKEMDWQTRKELERLLERQKELEKEIQQAKESFDENLQNQQEFEQQSEDIQEKQEQLQKLFEEATNEEMEELRKKIEELLQEMEKEEALEMLENFQFNDEEMENELDRMLELFKQLEVEKELQESIDELQELAEQQEDLAEQTENQEQSQEELQEEQQEINESFEDLKEKIDELQEKNEALESPKDMDERGQEMDQIEMDLEQSQEQLQQNQNQNASESQKNAAQKMKEMANSMSMEMQSAQMQQMQEDMQSLRQLLENLVGLSFEQEDLMDEFDQVIINTPRYVDLVQNQFKLQDDFKIVEDSLSALSKRVFQIEAYVTEKVSEIKSNLRSGIDDLEERKKTQASVHQQFTMKNLNDLALMLSETMNQMQQQMAAMMSGQQMCNNPNPGQQGQKGNVPSDKISEGQKQLNEEMRNMQQKQGEGGEGISSQEFAKMAARQAALRKALREKQKQLQENGKGISEQLQELMDQMDDSETDLVNKRLNNEMMKRQQDILTRLLESERAERERELDDQRKSESAQQFERKIPPSLEEYLKERASQIEMYRAVSPNLKPYYKFLVEEYFKQLKEN